MEPNKCIQFFILWKYSFKSFLWFLKIWWVREKQGVMFLMVPSKDRITLQTLVLSPKEYNILFENIFNWLIM
jgi:hypothetical protein